MTEDGPLKKTTSINFTYHDPGRTFDGTPFEASGKAVEQTSSVVNLLRRSISDTTIQVRNAYLQRNIEATGDPNVEGWESSGEYKMLLQFARTALAMKKKLRALHKATTYDPSHPPKD